MASFLLPLMKRHIQDLTTIRVALYTTDTPPIDIADVTWTAVPPNTQWQCWACGTTLDHDDCACPPNDPD